MKKIIVILTLLPLICQAQVGINTTTPLAELDVKSNIATSFLMDINFNDDYDGVTTSGSPAWSVQSYQDSICFSSNNTTANQNTEVTITVIVPDAKVAFLSFDIYIDLTTAGLLDLGKTVLTSADNTNWTNIVIPLTPGTSKYIIVLRGDGSSNFPGKVAIDNVKSYYQHGYALRIEDLNQETGHVLTSDEFGNATWKESRPGIVVDNDGDTYVLAEDNNTIVKAIQDNQVYYQDLDSLHITADKINLGTLRDSLGNIKWGLSNVSTGNYGTVWGGNNKATGDGATVWGNSNMGKGQNSTVWGSSNVASGLYSTSWGQNSKASGNYSTAFGFSLLTTDTTFADGLGSVAWGWNNEATETGATAFGWNNTSSGFMSTVWGRANSAVGVYSTVWGDNNTAAGINSTAFGTGTVADTLNAVAMGNNTLASGVNSVAMGVQTYSLGDNSMTWGGSNVNPSDSVTATGVSSTAWGVGTKASGGVSTVWGQANIVSGSFSTSWGSFNNASGLNSTSWGAANIASGPYSTSWGTNNTASGPYSTSWGDGNDLSGIHSTSWGTNNNASGPRTTVWGAYNSASGEYSTAWGFANNVSGEYSTAWGRGNDVSRNISTSWGLDNIVSGAISTSWGYENNVSSIYATSLGYFSRSLTGDPTSIIPSDPLFQIGNGSSSSRNDALIILKNGNVGIDFSETDGSPQYSLHVLGQIVGDNVAASSDSRIKKNQNSLEYGLNEVLGLVPKTYDQFEYSFPDNNLKLKGTGTPSIGLIAQEVYELVPEAVLVPEDENSNIWHLDYTKLIPVLINAVKELNIDLENVRSENEELKAKLEKLEDLEARINALEGMD